MPIFNVVEWLTLGSSALLLYPQKMGLYNDLVHRTEKTLNEQFQQGIQHIHQPC
jgi:hypothetical protein